MSCTACAQRIEKKLNKLDGVEATVNYSTERAVIRAAGDSDPQTFVDVVVKTGYGATVRADHVNQNADHRRSAGLHSIESLKRRLVVAAILTIPVALLSMIPSLQFDYWQWVALALATPVVLWCAYPFHYSAVMNFRFGSATMDTLISVGVSAAYLWSVYAMVFGHAGDPKMRMEWVWLTRGNATHEIYLEVAAAVTLFILAGHYLEARAKRQSGAALRALMEVGAKNVTVLRNGAERSLPAEHLVIGDVFVTKPGEKVATDGVILQGASTIDEAMLTGESIPVEVTVSDNVTGGTVNVGGRIVVRATAVGKDTQLAQLAQLVEQAQEGKAEVQRLADRVSAWFVPAVIALSVVTALAWILIDGVTATAFAAAIAVLIISCPCALGLATPTALMVGTGRGAQLGIVIKGPQVLESTRRIDTIVLDKTGTITTGEMSVSSIDPAPGVPADRLIQLAASVENASEHPVAQAIASAAEPGPITDFVNHAGFGVSAIVGAERVSIGRPSWVAEQFSVNVPQPDLPGTTVAVIADGQLLGTITVADSIKPSSAGAIAQLMELGLTPVLLTGDNQRAASAVAEVVGIQTEISEVSPAEKLEVITKLHDEGKVVAMVGDGVNDAAALARADLGIAMGTGTDVAMAASDLTIVSGDLRATVDAIRLSRSTLRTIKTNLFWAFAYNVAAIPLAAFGLLNPLIAGLAMALSSVFVVTNSLRLRRFQAEHVSSGQPTTSRPTAILAP